MKKRNIFWGLLFIIMAVMVIVNQLGMFVAVSMWGIAFAVLLVAIMIQSIIRLNFGGILFPLALLAIIFHEQLHIENLVPWPVLLTALLGTIGLSIIFKKNAVKIHSHSGKHKKWNKSWNIGEEEDISEENGNVIHCDVSFGSGIKYINSEEFEKADIDCSFGALKVYFDNCKLKNSRGEIYVDSSFSGVQLYIPKTWQVIHNVESSFGSFEEKNHATPNGTDQIYISGDVSFGAVDIYYV